MRTTIEVNDELITSAMKLANATTKREVIKLALEHYVAYLRRRNMKLLFGKVKWDGNLAQD